jgi:hypothetical protein
MSEDQTLAVMLGVFGAGRLSKVSIVPEQPSGPSHLIWRLDAELVAGRDGYTSQSVMVWGPEGRPIALSQKSMFVFG